MDECFRADNTTDLFLLKQPSLISEIILFNTFLFLPVFFFCRKRLKLILVHL